MQENDLMQRIQRLEDTAALKKLVDSFSNLADQKDIDKQILLFTEDATVESYFGSQLVSSLAGREQIGAAFAGYLANFDTVYHHNGQQTVEIQGNTATGVSYCLVVLIGMDKGKRIQNTSGVYYHDHYVRRGAEWLIARRVSHFTWQERTELPTAAQ
jgi:ketosteroid isomerase-like protein